MEKPDHNLEKWVDNRIASLSVSSAWYPDTESALSRLRAADRTRGRRTWVIAAALAAGVAGVVVLPGGRALAEYCLQCISSSAVAVKPAANQRKMAPDLAIPDDSNRTVVLSELKGRVVLLNFWATWCPPCRAEMPVLAGFERTYGGKGLTVLGVSFDDGWDAVRPFLAAQGIRYPVMLGNDAIAASFGGAKSLPVTFLIDKFGRIAATYQGVVNSGQLDETIRGLLAEPDLIGEPSIAPEEDSF